MDAELVRQLLREGGLQDVTVRPDTGGFGLQITLAEGRHQQALALGILCRFTEVHRINAVDPQATVLHVF